MKLRVMPEILRDFPGLTIGVVVAHNSNNQKKDTNIEHMLRSQEVAVAASLLKDELSQYPAIAAWREVYKKFGAKPKDHHSSVENLAKRVLSGQQIKSINPFVDIYNYISLKYLLPLGGEDLDTIVGDMQLVYASAQEKAVKLLGEKEARVPEAGEVIYKDDEGVICRRWNWKEAERTKITDQTKNAIFVVELLPPVEPRVVRAATHELALVLEKQCGGNVSVAFLDEKNPEVTIKKNGAFQPLDAIKPVALDFSVYEAQKRIEAKLSTDHALRVQKIDEMRKHNREPWPAKEKVTATCKEVIDAVSAGQVKQYYAVAGRVMTIRLHGKAAFAHIQDRSGKLQIYIKQDIVGDEQFSFFKDMIDVGDYVWCYGFSFITKTGEATIEVEKFTLLSKCLFPLPEKFHGLTDIETKYRQRYLDLMTNAQTRDRFIKRTSIIREIREFLTEHDFVEVETPMLHPIPGGAAARPFITHHNALDSELYLRIAPELYLKRLVVGGIERVFEINRNFRNEGISTRHNPEFTMLEFYMAHEDYHFAMDFVEELFRLLATSVCGQLQLPFGNHMLDFGQPFKRLSMVESLITVGGLSNKEVEPATIASTIKKLGVEIHNNASYGEQVYALFEKLVESKLIQPTFIIDFPVEVSPLAKRDPQNPAIAARFELFIAGLEISNGFNELNDPYDQAERFKQQAAAHSAGFEEAHRYDADYVHALEFGLPPTVGVGIGIDRLVMLLTNTTSIKEVILFPTLKRKED